MSSIFKDDRKDFEQKWDDLKIFINYGMLSQEDFFDRAKDFALLKDTEGKYFTYEEYKTLIKDNQTDKDGTLVYLYANNTEDEYAYIEAAKQKGYSVLLLNGDLDVPMVSMLEQKFEKSRFTRVDSDIIDRLIVKEDRKENPLDEQQTDNLSQAFRSQMPTMEQDDSQRILGRERSFLSGDQYGGRRSLFVPDPDAGEAVARVSGLLLSVQDQRRFIDGQQLATYSRGLV